MNPIEFACSFCSRPIAAPPGLAGRMDVCPHCQSPVLVPARVSAVKPSSAPAIPALPKFNNPLPPSGDAPDSIFHDPTEDGDSLFGAAESSRKPVLPPAAPTATAKSTARIAGLPAAAPRRANATPIANSAPFVPVAITEENPFESLADDVATVDSAIPSGPDDGIEDEDDDAPPRPLPWKNLLIAALAFYSVTVTVIAAWGWLRPAPTAQGVKR